MKINSMTNGPLLIEGAQEIRVNDSVHVLNGKTTTLCLCGQSGNKPFCDGTHTTCDFSAAGFTVKIPNADQDTSDGSHTFSELYNHRHALMLNLAMIYKDKAFVTKKDSEGNEMKGWFILGINTKYGQISYHLPNTYWGMVRKLEQKEINNDYDGHSSSDVVTRLLMMVNE